MVTLTDPANAANTYSFDEVMMIRTVRRRLKSLNIPGTSGYIDYGWEPIEYEVRGISNTSPPTWLESTKQVSISGSAVVPDGTYILAEMSSRAEPPLRFRLVFRLRTVPPTYIDV